VIQKVSNSLNRTVAQNLHQNRCTVAFPKSVVSFTFDDFQQSTLQAVLPLFKREQIKGTFYTALGLENHYDAVLGQHFRAADIHRLIENEQEIGAHTFSHLNLAQSRSSDILADLAQEQSTFKANWGIQPAHFAYPFGAFNVKSKGICSQNFCTSRSTLSGINGANTDLNLLKANKIYSHLDNLDQIIALLQHAKSAGAWVIFYTHDIQENPSQYGTTPAFFQSVLSAVQSMDFDIKSVGAVYASLKIQ
jgi:peptidoglycan/xylan/chitin deacetylase (PgdA/CDA1 family)